MIKRRIERIAVTLLSAALLLSSTGIASSLAVNELGGSGSAAVTSTSTEKSSTTVSQEGGALSVTTVTTEGGKLTDSIKGSGTSSDPYKISNASDLLAMQDKINFTASSNKYFVLTNDIDLSEIKASDFYSNKIYSGSLISVSKNLEKSSKNVYFIFDGNGHTIKNLNVTASEGGNFAIFGYINSRSTVKNLNVENSNINVTSDSEKVAVLVAENSGVVTGCKLSNSTLSMKSSASAGLIAAVNSGEISDTQVIGNQSNVGGATAESHTLCGYGTIGAVVGSNSGKITGATALDIGNYIDPSHSGKAVYGGIVGASSGTISNSFASGNVTGGSSTDVVGGLVGASSDGAEFINNYILVALSCNASGNGLIGSGAKSETVKDCYWSSAVSQRAFAVSGASYDGDINSLVFKAVKVGSKVSVTSAELTAAWGKASIKVKGGFSGYGDAISVLADTDYATVSGVNSGSVGWLGYTSEITLPSTVGNGAVKISQRFELPVLVVSSQGDGTESNPLVINNAADFGLLKYAHGVNARLGGNISVSSAAFAFVGKLDGCGHTLSVASPAFSEVSGSLKNVKAFVRADIPSAVFGKAIDVDASSVEISFAETVVFNANASVSGVMFNSVCGASALDDCRVTADVKAENANAVFGALVGSIDGNGTSIKNSGACVSISGSEKAANVAGVIGRVNATGVSVSNCYASGNNEVGTYSFVADIREKNVKFNSIYLSKGTKSALNFDKYSFADKAQFIEWRLNDNELAFFAGNGGSFELSVPAIKAMSNSTAKDYTLSYDSSSISASLKVEGGKLVISVSRKAGVVTVKGLPITVTNTATGLSTILNVSNGLEKDGDGRYVVSSAYDFAYISENISELYNASFVMSSDVDMSAISSLSPIGGTLVPFSGKFDGNGHVVKNLTVDGTSKAGLFASLSGAEIVNLTVSGARINAEGSYSAVLAGQVSGSTVIKNISITDSSVSSNGIYTGAVIGSVASGNSAISDITVSGCTVNSNANYVGALCGYACESSTAKQIIISKTSVVGAEYVGGVAGLIEDSFSLLGASLSEIKINGVSEVSGIAAGRDNATIGSTNIANSEISATESSAMFTAGGISSSFAASINDVKVENTEIKAGVAAGVVGKTVSGGKLAIKNANVINSKITAASVAAGILGVHNVGGTAVISNAALDGETTIASDVIAAGVVGDINGSESTLVAQDIKSLACVELSDSADATAAAGMLGRLNASAINNVQFSNVKVLGSVSGNASIGGLVGLIKGTGTVYSDSTVVVGAVCCAELKTKSTNENRGVVLGGVENQKSFDTVNADNLFKNIVVSTYFGNASVFGAVTGLTSAEIIDMDKPNGSAIEPSVNVLSTSEEIEITLSNLPKLDGYTFDTETGWLSEASERITVVSSSADSVVLKASRMAEISIVGYYVCATDSDIRIPVHFSIKSDVRTPLAGEGTSENPYLISSVYDLETMAYYESLGKYFALAQDISFNASDFDFGGGFYNIGNGAVTIGNAENAFKGSFTGLYNGEIHSINGLKTSGNVFGGLFGATESAVISDLVIGNAEICGDSYAGALIGNAENTVVRNVTINNSEIKSTQLGGVAGALIGYAKNVTVENVSVNGSSVATAEFATSATVEYAGGIAGVFSGKISKAYANNVQVNSSAVAGGIVGSAVGAKINGFSVNALVNAKKAGGVVGILGDSLNSEISDGIVAGTVNGQDYAAGVIAEAEFAESYTAKAKSSLISDTVVAAIANGSSSAAIIGKADKQTLTDGEGSCDLFTNVYYSSYQNEDVFGVRELNSIGGINSATDLSNIKCVIDGSEKSFITLDGETTVLGDSDLVLVAGNGSYKSFELCQNSFELSEVSSDPSDVLTFDSESSAISANGGVNGAKLVFTYANGLKLAVPVSYSSLLVGSGTQADPYLVSTADEFAVMMQNGGSAKAYYRLTSDIDLSGIEGAQSFAGVLDGNGYAIYDFTGASLFASVSGTIKNLAAVGFKLSSAERTEIGALAGILDSATIEDCVVIAEVEALGKVQDAGILAGRAINGTVIRNCLTSGKVTGEKLLAAGGIVGSAVNTAISGSVSTAYVSANGFVGGLVGDAESTKLANSVFANMTASKNGGNVAGRFDGDCVAKNVYFDVRASKNTVAVASGSSDGIKQSDTAALAKALDGFAQTDGYAVSSALVGTEKSAKFATSVEFAAMAIRYVSALNSGTATSYTDIKVPSQVNSNAVSVDRTDGLVITLMKNSDFGDCDNSIARFADPAKENSTEISYSAVDLSGKLDGKLIGVLLKSKSENGSDSFSSFTRLGFEAAAIGRVSVTDGEVYADLDLPEGYGFTVRAYDEQGNELEASDMKNEGVLINAGKSKSISLSFEIFEADSAWGLRTIWSVIGK